VDGLVARILKLYLWICHIILAWLALLEVKEVPEDEIDELHRVLDKDTLPCPASTVIWIRK
jgi:hypothetical protein